MQKRELNQLVLDLWRRLRTRKLDAVTIRQEMQEAERQHDLEKLFRDIQGARYHPIYEADQHRFSGDYLLPQ